MAYHVENMAQDAERGIAHQKQALIDRELERFMEHAVGPGRAARRADTGSAGVGRGMTGARFF